MNAIQMCMDERGWSLTPLPEAEGPGFSMNTPEGQRDAMVADMHGCRATVGEHPFMEIDEGTARGLYAEVVARRRCLLDAGFPVSEPPSEQTWVAKQLAQDPRDIPWDPYDDVTSLNQAEWSAMVARCPQSSLWGIE